MEQNITSIYTPNPLTVHRDSTVHDCITLMREKRISCLIVCDADRPIGIYTEADMVRTLSKEFNFQTTKIHQLMSEPVITASQDINVFEASNLLTTKKIRHLVITDNSGSLTGIVTQTDIISHYGEDYFIGVKNVRNVMTKSILTVDKKQLVHEVIDKMELHTAGCAIAVENEQPIGILTERDMASLIINQTDINFQTMAEVMSSPVFTIQSNTTTFEAVALMNRKKIRRLIVVDGENKITGILVQENIISDLEGNYIHFLKGILAEQSRKLEESLAAYQKQSKRLEKVLNSSLDMSIIVTDTDFNIVYLNHDSTQMFKAAKDSIIGQPINQLLKCDSFYEKTIKQIKHEIKQKGEYWFIHLLTQNQCIHHIESHITALIEQDGIVGYTLISKDITQKLHTEKRLLQASHVFEHSIEGIMVTDAEGTIQSINPAFTEITGYTAEEVIGKNPRILQSDRQPPEFYKAMWDTILTTGRWQGEIWNRRKSGEIFPERLAIASVKDPNGEITQFTAVFNDITDLKDKEEKINHRAYHDPLTELPNRLLFKDRLGQAITRARRNDTQLAVMFIDLDHFKRLNDTLGHLAGDEFLQQISMQFRSLLRDQDTISRFAGDEFTLLMEDSNGAEQAIIVAEKLLNLFNSPFIVKGSEVYLGASIGIANYPDDGNSPEQLLQHADTAMYHAKTNGRNNVQIFKNEMNTCIKQRASLEAELNKALGNHSLKIHYQPIIDLHSKKITSIEALLRWDNEGNSIAPEQFIPIAEESGLIVPIGEWVLRQTCNQMSQWLVDDVTGLTVSVNLSARQFREKDLMTMIERVLAETHLKPCQLNLEVTESSMMENMESSVSTLKCLKDLGIRILMDDFGTGYSSLTHLQKLPVDILKLDRTFVHDIEHDKDAARIASGIIAMAKDLRLEVIAEGVETEAQLHFLEEHGCDKVQGYLFHKPLTEEELKTVLQAQK